MDRNDIYYRAIRKYREITNSFDSCKNDRDELSLNNNDKDFFDTTKYLCHIEEDWILEIEKGLPFIEKAIVEERQFIRTDGEIVPIEKIKRISRSSVEHLAKHSEYITHTPKDGNIIPDKLFMSEKLSDYAVYENRFLYLLLDYLEKFISLRLNDIEKINSLYKSHFSINKEFQNKIKKYSLKVEFNQEIYNNYFSLVDKNNENLIQRIKNCQQIVNSFLNTELICEVKKFPTIHPPIVKTNVLKMNNNFKNALSLYEFLTNYKGNGYDVKEIKKNHVPFNDLFQNRIYDLLKGMSFETYLEGNSAETFYENRYLIYEDELNKEKQRKLDEKLQRLKKKAFDSEKNLEEYALLLEEKNSLLMKNSEELTRSKNEINELTNQIVSYKLLVQNYKDNIDTLNNIINKKIEEIANLNQKYSDDINFLKNEHQKEMFKLKNDYDIELYQTKQYYGNLEEELSQKIYKEYSDKILVLENNIENKNKECDDLNETYNVKINLLNTQLDSKNDENKQLKNSLDEMNKKYNSEIVIYKAEIIGLKALNGEIKPSEDFTSEEEFTNLEESYLAFTEFFENQWKMTKKEIIKKIKKDLGVKKKNK